MNYVDVDTQLRFITQIVRRCPTQTLRHAFVQAMREWCNQTRWLRKDVVQSTLNTQSGTEGPFLVLLGPADVDFLEVVWINDNMKGFDPSRTNPSEFPISPADRAFFNNLARPGQPIRYAYVPEGMFELSPTPDREYTLRISVALQPRDGARSVPDSPLVKYSKDIEAGALEYLFRIPGEAWSNEGKADTWGKTFRAGINNAKADAQRQFNTGAQRIRPQRFIRGGTRGYL